MFMFSVYFVISYFMAKQSYDSSVSASNDLSVIFGKQQCLESLINFVKEDYIRNETIYLWNDLSTV